jgi:hypoxanthine phosphoribosyltransferase
MVQVLDKEFDKYIPYETIYERVKFIAAQMNEELCTLNPLFLSVLNGSFFFAADLLKEIEFPCEISFVKVASYEGTQSTGRLSTLIGLDENIRGRNVVVLEDIVDTGKTVHELCRQLQETGAASVRIAALIVKPQALRYDVKVDYKAFEAADEFLIGYGLDYNKQGRHYRDIYKIKHS